MENIRPGDLVLINLEGAQRAVFSSSSGERPWTYGRIYGLLSMPITNGQIPMFLVIDFNPSFKVKTSRGNLVSVPAVRLYSPLADDKFFWVSGRDKCRFKGNLCTPPLVHYNVDSAR